MDDLKKSKEYNATVVVLPKLFFAVLNTLHTIPGPSVKAKNTVICLEWHPDVKKEHLVTRSGVGFWKDKTTFDIVHEQKYFEPDRKEKVTVYNMHKVKYYPELNV